MRIIDTLLPEFDREVTLTRQVLARVPEDRVAWKPHPKSFSLGELTSHIANLAVWGTETLTRTELDLGTAPPPPQLATRSDMLAAFDANAAAMRAALIDRSDADLMATWTLLRNGTPMFSMPKAVVLRSFVFSHLIHHRGQLSVYLRLLDVPVPSIYGPSADDPAF